MTDRTKKVWHIVGVSWAAATFEIFFLLCLSYFKGEWAAWLYGAAAVGGSVCNAALLAAEHIFYFRHKQIVYKSCIIAYCFFLIAAVIFYILLDTGFFEIAQSQESLQAYLEGAGSWMSAAFILIQFLQVIILPIPSTVTVVAGSALFGPLMGSIYSLIGIVLGSLAAFFVGRYAGYRVVAWLVGKETLEKWLKKMRGKDKLLLSAMFLLPVFPDDVLCFIAGLSSMSLLYFFIVILVSRVIAIFVTSYSVTIIPFNTWWGILIWIIFIAAVITLVVVLYRKMDDIQAWINKKFHRETRADQKIMKDEFQIEVVDPDGVIVSKGVKRGEEETKTPNNEEEQTKIGGKNGKSP